MNGIKEVNFPPLEPIHIEEFSSAWSGTGYTFKSVIRDLNTRGFSKAKIRSVRSNLNDPENVELHVDLFVPRVQMSGIYKIEGKIADFPIGGKGNYNVTMSELSGLCSIVGHLIEKDGDKYWKVNRVTMRPDVKNMFVNFENIVDGNQELSNVANAFFNQYWNVIYTELMPYTEAGIDRVLKHFANQISMNIPFEQLFPSN